MALESIQVSAVIPASADRIFTAWLSSQEHSAFTGGQAKIEPHVGGRHTAWDGYIEGVTVTLEEGRRIVQTWRSSDFPDGSTDSRLEVLLEPAEGGTKVTLVHTDIPEGQGRLYEQGWVDNYITPMQEYFLEGEDEEGEGEAPMGGTYPPPEAPAGGEVEESWGDEDEPAIPPAPTMEAPADEEMDEEPMEAPAPAAPKPKKPPAKKKPVAKKKAPPPKKKKPAAKKKPKPVAKKKPAAKKKAPAKKKPAKKKGKR